MSNASQQIPDEWRGKETVQLVGHSAYGGGAAVIFRIMHDCAALGLRPVLLATHPDVVAAARAEGFELWEFPGIVREPSLLKDLVVAVRLAIALRRRGTSIVHTHTSKGGMVGRLGAWLAGCPVVIHHTHGFYHAGLPRGLKRVSMKWLERFFARLGDVQVFLSAPQMDEAVAQGIVPARKARLIPNGIAAAPPLDASRCSQLRDAWGVPAGVPLIGTVSRLASEAKGLDVGLRAFASLARARDDAYWVILGEGEDRDALVATARELGIASRVIMPGHMEDVRDAYGCFDVMFAPSRREGQSISILEAMAAGRPIVSTTIPGNEGVLESGSSAILCPVDDAEAMTAGLSRLISDPQTAASLGCAAKQTYERRFTESRFDKLIAGLYVEALKHARPRC